MNVGSGEILVVDDNAPARELVGDSMLALGYRYLMATDGVEATSLMSMHPVDLVITDLDMPRMGGIELIQNIRSKNQELPIIIITAVVGAALAKHQGLAALQRIQRAMQNGEDVGRSLVEGALILVAGVMMLLPGFMTDAVGIGLLLPPIRGILAGVVVARARTRMERGGFVVVDLNGMRGDTLKGVPIPRVDDDVPPPGVIDV